MSARDQNAPRRTDNNFLSGMALVKRNGRYELVESSRILEEIRDSQPNPLPYEYRDLLQDETPREFRFINPHVGEIDAMEEHCEMLFTKATEYFANEFEVFARNGPDLCMHVCSCQTREDAHVAARLMEMLRQLVEDLANGGQRGSQDRSR